ncbi:hypothetical protein GOP47_0013683 [Adiantum capillus-veneris]|uniref:3-hydroxyacyl-CoA dehydrogenase n=1 Tax=Adiantum capillus-veneris TaxID=13818 RepID=A0A9D4UPH2_ADICA|nr:hypothetical protein GOP47_0013683 [Adiantum capillus-veneris]
MGVKLEVLGDGVGLITFSNPPVNALAMPILNGLKSKFEEASNRKDVKAIVVMGEYGKFSGGFDIATLLETQKTGNVSLLGRVSIDIMINTIEGSKKPSVAAIEGLALGGGLELAMSCNARIAAPKAQLGQPELQLGIIPGFGGTQRLPRLVGLSKAIEMMLSSKPVTSEEGKALGLVDAVVSSEQLVATARKWALDIAEGRKPRIISLQKLDKLEPLGEARRILQVARTQAKQRSPNIPHPIWCLDAIEEGVVSGGYAGSLKEEQCFKTAVMSPTGKALVHIFFAQRATTKVPGVTDCGLKSRPLKKVAVIGGGLMGSGIATAFILSNIPVLLKELNESFLQQGLDRIKANLDSRAKKGSLSKEKYNKAFSLVKGTLDYKDFKDVDLVIEAVIENIQLKQQIFQDLEKYCPSHCILATNTSTIDLNLVAQKIRFQDRVIGAHFFSPAHVMPLLEIVRSNKTAPQVIVDLIGVGKVIKKVPVVVGNCTGFAINRMFFPYIHSAHMLANLGIDVYRIDRVITAFGMPMGPFRLADLVGYEVSRSVADQFAKAFPERTYRSQLISLLMEENRLGQKNGRGFYLYDRQLKATPDPDFKKFLDESRRRANIMPNGKPIVISDEEIVERMFFPVVNEACRILDEKIAVKASDLDISSVLGFGFPAYRGGVVFWGDSLGAACVCDKLREWSKTFGTFYQPCTFLEDRARRGLSLEAAVDAKSRL